MHNSCRPHRPDCPHCGHQFTLPELKDMAVGDGWERYVLVEDGEYSKWVTFNEYHPLVHILQTKKTILSSAARYLGKLPAAKGGLGAFAT